MALVTPQRTEDVGLYYSSAGATGPWTPLPNARTYSKEMSSAGITRTPVFNEDDPHIAVGDKERRVTFSALFTPTDHAVFETAYEAGDHIWLARITNRGADSGELAGEVWDTLVSNISENGNRDEDHIGLDVEAEMQSAPAKFDSGLPVGGG